MKIIQIQEDTDGNGSKIMRPQEPFPTDTIYTTMIDEVYVCYQKGDVLPENASIPAFFKKT